MSTNFSFLDQPLGLVQIFTPTYLGLVALSTVVIGGMVVIDRRLDGISWYGWFNAWLSDQQKFSVMVMRVAMAARRRSR